MKMMIDFLTFSTRLQIMMVTFAPQQQRMTTLKCEFKHYLHPDKRALDTARFSCAEVTWVVSATDATLEAKLLLSYEILISICLS